MINPGLLDECTTMALAVAPELARQPLYILDSARLGLNADETGSCYGWCELRTNPLVVATLGDEWRGPGTTIALNVGAIQQAALPGSFADAVRTVMLHELGHAVPVREYKPAAAITPVKVAWSRRLTEVALQTRDAPLNKDPHHDHTFVRRCAHLYVRATEAGFNVCSHGLLSQWLHLGRYLPMLSDECTTLKHATFAEIEATDPPADLLTVFDADCNHLRRLFANEF